MKCYRCGADLKKQERCSSCDLELREAAISFLFPLEKGEVEQINAFYTKEKPESIKKQEKQAENGATRKQDSIKEEYDREKVVAYGVVDLKYHMGLGCEKNGNMEEAYKWYKDAAAYARAKKIEHAGVERKLKGMR